jgi:tetratricopeptide (TPR) repeat protein
MAMVLMLGCSSPDPANAAYLRAEERYIALDLDSAERECRAALELNPNHAAAHALLGEIQFLTRPRDAMGPPYRVQGEQILIELRDAYQRAVRAYNLGNHDEAAKNVSFMLQSIPWLMETPEIEGLSLDAVRLARRIRNPQGEVHPLLRGLDLH